MPFPQYTVLGRRVAGFTLIELLAVVALFGLLLGLVLPAIQSARRDAERTERRNWKRLRHLDEPSTRSVPFHILFIGNSHTDYGDIPGVVREMSRLGRCPTVITSSIIVYGETLEGHWQRGIATEVIEQSATDWFDFVVLQEMGLRPCTDRASFVEHGSKFIDTAIRANAIPLQYLPFARAEDCPTGYCPQDTLTEATIGVHRSAKGEKGLAEIGPVGEAWRAVRQARPKLPLLRDDGVHATALGAYLTACVFYSVIHRRSPVGLPSTIVTPKKTLRVAPEHATVLQAQAWDTCEAWRRRSKAGFLK